MCVLKDLCRIHLNFSSLLLIDICTKPFPLITTGLSSFSDSSVPPASFPPADNEETHSISLLLRFSPVSAEVSRLSVKHGKTRYLRSFWMGLLPN